LVLEDGTYEGEDGAVSLLISTSGDLNGDAAIDVAAILVLNSRGSGVFYYLNVLLIKFDFMDIYGAGSVSRLTGVSIHPDDHGQLVVGYYVHGPEQAYTGSPAIYVTRHWKIDDRKLVSVEDY
jgi:hypothetical protein